MASFYVSINIFSKTNICNNSKIKLVNINNNFPKIKNQDLMNDSFLKQTDNQFLANNNHVTYMKGRSQSVDAIINKLNQKNSLLKKQVNKIDRVLSSLPTQQKTRYGITLPQIKPDVIKKQLDNAYKQIRIYQHEISKKKSAQSEIAFVEQYNKIERIFKEKNQFHQKLKRQYQSVKQKSKEYIKLLKNDNLKNQYIEKQLKLNNDIKWLQQMIRQSDQKRAASITKLQKQRKAIKEMEIELLKENSNEYLESIKFRIFKPNQNNQLTPTRSIFDIENQHLNTVQNKIQDSRIEPQIQDKTPQAFQSLTNDVKLLKKMQSDYELKINLLNKQRQQAAEKNFRSRNKLLEIQFEIQTLQKNIAECKKFIDPKMLKPKLSQSLLAQSRMSQKKQIVKKGPTIPHQFKYLQTGEITKQGKRFSDRIAIGKKNTKIVGMTLYEKQQTGQFVGIQATYEMSDHKKVANLNLLIDTKKTPVSQQQHTLDFGDFIKTIDLFVKKNIITGISMVSKKGKVIKAGDFSGQRKILKMQQEQYPMCFYGSLLLNGFQCFGVQIYQVKNKQQ